MVKMLHSIDENAIPHSHQRQGQSDGDDQQHGIHQCLDPGENHPARRSQVIGGADGAHQSVGGAHGEINGEEEAE